MRRSLFTITAMLGAFLVATLMFACGGGGGSSSAPKNIVYVEAGASGTTGTSADPVGTVQEGIDLAAVSQTLDTVQVAAGTYTEDVVIAAPVTLVGAGAGMTILQGVDKLGGSNFPLAYPNIDIQANSVVMTGFTINSPAVGDTEYSSGIVLTGVNIEIYDNAFVVATGDVSQAIQTWAGDNAPAGLRDISGLYIHDNTFTHLTPLPSGVNQYEAIYLNPQSDPADTANPVIIANNTFSGALIRAVAVDRPEVIIQNNTISTTGATYATVFPMGIRTNTDASGVSILSNSIAGFENGVLVNNTLTADDDVVINNNSITGNTSFGVNFIGTAGGFTVDATANWWGADDGPSGVGPGTGDVVSADVDFAFFLTAAP